MRRAAAALAATYERFKEKHLGPVAELVPRRYRSQFVCYPGASEVQHILDKAIPSSARRVLIVGVFAGRDYFFLKSRGTHELFAFDLERAPDFDNMIAGNIEDKLPFPEKYFDAIVINEVLEHLVEDAKALGNLRDCLKEDGILFVSVPFLHESEPTHVRVHTRVSAERLLACCGFTPFEIIERPGLGFYVPWVNQANFAASLLTEFATGRTAYEITLPWLGRLERWAGALPNRLRRRSRYWGAFFVCTKTIKANYLDRNRRDFCHQDQTTTSLPVP
jgi:SAM-dependent methyltransferase